MSSRLIMSNMEYPVWSGSFGWREQFERLPQVRRINEDNFFYLKSALQDCEWVDSFQSSPNYYYFTGRRGLWLYEDYGSFLCVCAHPNLDNELLVFMPLTECPLLFDSFLKNLPEPLGRLTIARVSETKNIDELSSIFASNNIKMQKIREPVLDWAYPVHILSTSRLSVLAGKNFMYLRNRLRQIAKHEVDVVPFDAVHHSRVIEGLLHRWVSKNAGSPYEYRNLYDPYETLFSWALNQQAGMSGAMIFIGSRLEAVGLWDISNIKRRTANLFVNLCNTEIKGLSEFLIIRAAETLLGEGIQFLNMGGSETAGLDHYKRKFIPDTSLPLASWSLSKKDIEASFGNSARYG